MRRLALVVVVAIVQVAVSLPHWGVGTRNPESREETAMHALRNGDILMWGGTEDTGESHDDVILMDPVTFSFATVPTQGRSPGPRRRFCSVLMDAPDGDELLAVYGGSVGFLSWPQTLSVLSTRTWTWRSFPVPGVQGNVSTAVGPGTRYSPACARRNATHFVVFGGTAGPHFPISYREPFFYTVNVLDGVWTPEPSESNHSLSDLIGPMAMPTESGMRVVVVAEKTMIVTGFSTRSAMHPNDSCVIAFDLERHRWFRPDVDGPCVRPVYMQRLIPINATLVFAFGGSPSPGYSALLGRDGNNTDGSYSFLRVLEVGAEGTPWRTYGLPDRVFGATLASINPSVAFLRGKRPTILLWGGNQPTRNAGRALDAVYSRNDLVYVLDLHTMSWSVQKQDRRVTSTAILPQVVDHRMVSVRDKAVLIGGLISNLDRTINHKVFVLDTNTHEWAFQNVSNAESLLKCYAHSATAVAGDRIIVHGGFCRLSSDHSIRTVGRTVVVHVPEDGQWWAEDVSNRTGTETHRSWMQHTCSNDPARSRVIRVGDERFDQSRRVASLDISSDLYPWTWHPTTVAHGHDVPHDFRNHNAELYGRHLFVVGGTSSNHPEPGRDVYMLDVDTWVWTKPAAVVGPLPPGRQYGASTLIGAHLVLCGGEGFTGYGLRDVWYLDLESLTWHKPDLAISSSVSDTPTPTSKLAMTSVGSKAIVYGGNNVVSGASNETYVLHTGVFSASVDVVAGDDVRCMLHSALTPCATLDAALQMFATKIPNAVQAHSGVRALFHIVSGGSQGPPLRIKPLVVDAPITLRGNPLSPGVIECISPDENVASRCIVADGTDKLVFRDLTIRGTPGRAGGLSFIQTPFHADNCRFEHHNTQADGGVIFGHASDVSLRNCVFESNSAVHRGGAITLYIGSLDVQQTRFESNSATSGGALHLSFATASITRGSVFEENIANTTGGAIFSYYSSVKASDAIFSRNIVSGRDDSTDAFQGLEGLKRGAGGGALLQGTTFLVTNCTFSGNEAVYGGAIFGLRAPLEVNSSAFLGNQARVSAGALYADLCPKASLVRTRFLENVAELGSGGASFVSASVTTLVSSAFIRNAAPNGGGGAVHWIKTHPDVVGTDNVFEGNSASYGLAFSSEPARLRLLDGPYVLPTPQTSGSLFTRTFRIGLFDFGDNLVRSDNRTYIVVQALSNFTTRMPAGSKVEVLGTNVVQTEHGVGVFSGMGLQAPPGRRYFFDFRATFGDRDLYLETAEDIPYVDLRRCEADEYTEDNVCRATSCSYGQHLVVNDIGEPFCLACPVSGAVCTGSDLVRSEADFWLYLDANRQAVSVACQTQRCLSSEECKADIELASDEGWGVVSCCAKGRVNARYNPLCGKCIDGFYEWGTACVECRSPNWPILVLLFAASWGYVLFFHRISQSTTGNAKIALYMIQSIVVIFGASETPWLQWLNVFAFNVFRASEGVCIAPIAPTARFMLGIFVPVVCIVELLLTWGIAYCAHWLRYHRTLNMNGRGNKFHKSAYIRSCIALFLFTFNSVSSTLFSYFKCVDVGPNESVMAEFPSIDCNSETYKSLEPWIWFLFVLVVVVLPVCTVVIMRRLWLFSSFFRRPDKRHKMFTRFGILFECYRAQYWFWEVVVFYRRAITIGLAVAFYERRRELYMALSLSNIVILIMHVFAQPFRSRFDNLTETISLTLLTCLTIFLTNASVPFSAPETAVLVIIVYMPLVVFTVFMILTRLKSIDMDAVLRAREERLRQKYRKQAVVNAAEEVPVQFREPQAHGSNMPPAFPVSSSVEMAEVQLDDPQLSSADDLQLNLDDIPPAVRRATVEDILGNNVWGATGAAKLQHPRGLATGATVQLTPADSEDGQTHPGADDSSDDSSLSSEGGLRLNVETRTAPPALPPPRPLSVPPPPLSAAPAAPATPSGMVFDEKESREQEQEEEEEEEEAEERGARPDGHSPAPPLDRPASLGRLSIRFMRAGSTTSTKSTPPQLHDPMPRNSHSGYDS